MIRLLVTFILAALIAFPVQATKKNPGYVRDQGPEMRSGDWYLLCDAQNNCAIRGVVKRLKRPAQSRALVMLDRGADANAPWYVRIVFLDNAGRDESREALPEGLRLFRISETHKRTPVPLELEGGAGNPVRYLPRSRISAFFAMLTGNKKTEIREQGLAFATMPHGNLRKLLDYAEREQRSHVPQVAPEELEGNGGPPRFDFDIFAAEDEIATAKPELEQPCGELAPRRNRVWKLTQSARLWLVDCPRETKVYRQFRGGVIEQLHLDDLNGKRYHPRQVEFDPATGLMMMIVRKKGRSDCGYQMSWGWNGDNGFVLISSAKMPLCRNIPTLYWPKLWEAGRWRVMGSALDHGYREPFFEPVPDMPDEYAPEPKRNNSIQGKNHEQP
jgi:Protein of unknown function (DUF1176)